MNILPYVHPVSMLFSNIMNIFSEKAEQKVDKTEKQIYNKTEVIIWLMPVCAVVIEPKWKASSSFFHSTSQPSFG